MKEGYKAKQWQKKKSSKTNAKTERKNNNNNKKEAELRFYKHNKAAVGTK